MKATETNFLNKSCLPCQEGVPPLSSKITADFLTKLNQGWKINSLGHLHKKYSFDNFIKAMIFANQITEVAEKEGHHPNLTISWGNCIVEIWTHKINGLTENDFILAAKIENLS